MQNSKLTAKIVLLSLVTFLIFNFLFSISGCVSTTTTDPNTGEAIKVIALDPNVAAAINKGESVAIILQPLIQSMSVLWSGFGIIGSAIAGLLTAWGLMKNKVTVASTKAEQITNVTTDLIRAVQVWKETDPVTWEKIKTEFSKILGPDGSAVVDGIRAALETKAAS